MLEHIVCCFCSWPHLHNPLYILHCLEDELSRFCLAEVVEILFRRHPGLITAVLWDWIRNLDGVGESPFFSRERVSGFELQRIAVRVPRLGRVFRAPLGQLPHRLVESFCAGLFFEQPRRTIGNHYPTQAQHQQSAHPTCCSHVSLSPWWIAAHEIEVFR